MTLRPPIFCNRTALPPKESRTKSAIATKSLLKQVAAVSGRPLLTVAARSREVLTNLLHRQPDSMDARRGLAAIALDAGDLNEALEHHLKLLEMGEKTPDVFYNTGLLSQKLGKTEEAATHYRSALNERPEFPEALLNLGHVLKSLGREDQAKTYWALAIEAKPDLAAGYFRQ